MTERKSNKNNRPSHRRKNKKNNGKPNPFTPIDRRVPTTERIMLNRVPLFPISRRVTGMLYHGIESITSTTGVPAGKVWIANGLYDPDITGSGHQPMGFDQMMLLYDQYTVLKSRLTVLFSNESSTDVINAVVYVSPDTTVQTDPNAILENGLVVRKTLQHKGVAGSVAKVSIPLDIASYLGRRNYRNLLEDTSLSGTAAGNPVEGVYFTISVWDIASAATATVDCDIILEYDAIFWEPRKLNPS